MSLIATAVRYLMKAGASQEDILAAIVELEVETERLATQTAFEADAQIDRRTPGARRTAKWRASHSVTQRHSETESDACDGAPSLTPVPLSPSPKPPSPNPLTPEPIQKKEKGAARATALPENFEPNDADRATFREIGIGDLNAEVVAFRDFHAAKGSVFRDWHAALRTWLRSPYRTTPNRRGTDARKAQTVHSAAEELVVWAAEQERAQQRARAGPVLAIGSSVLDGQTDEELHRATG